MTSADDAHRMLVEEIRDGQRQLLAEVRALREAIETAREPTGSLRFKDRAAMARILPVLAAHFPGRFAGWELIDCAAADDALGANLRIVLGRQTAKQLGQLFSRVAGHEINGHRLIRVGSDANGSLWQAVANTLP